MNCSEGDESHEVGEQLVIARCDTAEVFEPIEETLGLVALLVEVLITGMRSATFVAWRDDRDGAGVEDSVVKVLGIPRVRFRRPEGRLLPGRR